jgi:hypothetical protein
MAWSFLFSLFGRRPAPQRRSFQPLLEALEDRLVMTGTSTALSANPAPGLSGSPVTFTAVVTPVGGVGTPTGQVVLQQGGFNVATASLSLVGAVDEATFTLASLPVGNDTLTAAYQGNASFSASSGSCTETIESWSISAQPQRAFTQDYNLAVGEASIDLYNGGVQLSQAMDFSRSDAARSQQMFALSYDPPRRSPKCW